MDGHEEETKNVVGAKEEAENFVRDGTKEEDKSHFVCVVGLRKIAERMFTIRFSPKL